ncbi:hypothetical protein QUC80_10875 [Staphylococcus aureus]
MIESMVKVMALPFKKKFNEVLGNIESSNMYRDNIDFDDIELHWIN